MQKAMAAARPHPRIFVLTLACTAVLLAVPLASEAQALRCGGKKVTIKGTPGNDVIVGRKASDVIWGGGGNDRISGGPNGNDTICGGPGNDVIHAGRGFDKIYGGGGDDRLYGETGSDRIFGGAGDDELSGFKGADGLYGGSGNDLLLGFKGPDRLNGNGGNDFADGQQGSDQLAGGSGDDVLLGDKGNDRIHGNGGDDRIEGGPGDDTALEGGPGTDQVFGGAGIDHADGGPGDGDVVRGDNGTDTLDGGPGANDIVSYASASRGGIQVDLRSNRAKGDGHDDLAGFEDIVGSPQADTLIGNGEPNRIDGGVGNDTLQSGGGGGEAFGGPGTDSCDGFAAETSCGPEPHPPGNLAYGILNEGLDGSSLVVQGSPSDDDIRVAKTATGWVVSSRIPVFAGEGCVNPPSNPSAIVCETQRVVPLLVVTGGPGDDTLVIDPGVPASAKVRINGNGGNDRLVGGSHDDVLEAGENYNGPDFGHDVLEGNGGSDVLYADPGGDRLLGGPGTDLLVNSVATCQGHYFDGDGGLDTVSYARSRDRLRIVLGGTGGPPGCGNRDRILASNESLEGSDGPDVLIGDNGPNSMMGHLGADVFIGKSGNDFIEAADGRRDRRIECGGGRDELVRDGADPRGSSC